MGVLGKVLAVVAGKTVESSLSAAVPRTLAQAAGMGTEALVEKAAEKVEYFFHRLPTPQSPQPPRMSKETALKKASEGDPDAMYVLSEYERPMYWLREAANLGHVYAQSALAGHCTDKAEAFKWCRMAAEQGHTQSMLALAMMYEHTYGPIEGVPKDNIEALKWLMLYNRCCGALKGGNFKREDRIAKSLWWWDRAEARRRAKSFVPTSIYKTPGFKPFSPLPGCDSPGLFC